MSDAPSAGGADGAQPSWSGTWVADRLDIDIRTGHAPLGVDLADLVGLAVRRNPRRAHLLVSTVLGKHVPTDPRLVYGSGLLLGALVAKALSASASAPHPRDLAGGDLVRLSLAGVRGAASTLVRHVLRPGQRRSVPEGTVVLGYAETATALGHAVADALDAPTLHSTRRPVPGITPVGGFEEEHSHATSHLMLPEDPALLAGTGPLVLVDDELSTGTTALNTIAALHAVHPRGHYVIAALVDLRSAADHDRMAKVAADLGARIDMVALAAGRVDLPADVLARGQQVVAEIEAAVADRSTDSPPDVSGTVRRVDVGWPRTLRDGGRHGFAPADRRTLEVALPKMAAAIAEAIAAGSPAAAAEPGGTVHVLGFEELMYAPLRLAAQFADLHPQLTVTYSTTTRSPVVPIADDGYAIRSRLTFPAHDNPADGPGPRFAFNVAPATATDEPFDTVVLVVDEAADTEALTDPGGLVSQLVATAGQVVLVVIPDYRPALRTHRRHRRHLWRDPVATPAPSPIATLPEPLTGPAFGSYPAEDVLWLLKDLSGVELEAPTEEREEAIQAGGAHYAESLPVEYQPDADYQDLFTAALESSAERLAYAVGLVTEQVLAMRGDDAVLVSLARAGTPVGVLMRRWAKFAHDRDVPHYAVSIVRGKGIDHVALAYLAEHHDPANVMFVDGWTGKGAITRELAASVAEANEALGTRFAADMAVLADTGRCVKIFGTREDYLIPSACLNSTVSGLVSRTVLNDSFIGEGEFHGAKFYADLAAADVSMDFIDAVVAKFTDVRAQVAADLAGHLAADRTPTWAGWAAVEEVSDAYGIGDVNLVKPGVGETTRVLLRRVPWAILVHPDSASELTHVRVLAEQRGVRVVEVDDLPYSCIGLIHPKFTRGATGADGTASSPGTGQ